MYHEKQEKGVTHNDAQNYKCGIKVRISFSGRHQAPVNMIDSMEGVRHGCCSILLQILEVLQDIISLDPETVQLSAFYIPSAVFTGACGPPEKLSLTLVPCSNVLHMIAELNYCQICMYACM